MVKMINRLGEPSTWAGLAALVAIFSPELAEVIPEIMENVILVAGAIAGIVAVVKKEKAGWSD